MADGSSFPSNERIARVTLPTLHSDQVKAFWARQDPRALDERLPEAERLAWRKNGGGQRVALRCGRRWGKTKYGETRACDGAINGQSIGWFAPDYKKLSEAYQDIKTILTPVIVASSKIDGVIRVEGGGRIDFWTLNDPDAGRSRFYHGAVMDEGAFTKNGPLEDKTSMLSIWENSIEPTLFDYGGWALVASNTNGADPENFLYAISKDPRWGFISYHAPTINNPILPMRLPGESAEEHWERRQAVIAGIRATKHPLVFLQEYEAEFVDWRGVAFFALDRLLIGQEPDYQPVAVPIPCDIVFATMDTAVKTGSQNDGTGVVYWAYTRERQRGRPLVALDWELEQIEGASLEDRLPQVVQRLNYYATNYRARFGSAGVFIEDRSSGQVLLQKAERHGMLATPIDSALTAMGKDERAIAVSDYVYQQLVGFGVEAYNRVENYKGSSRNHLVSQVTGFRIGDKAAATRADDLLDCFCYGISLSLGNAGGF